MLELELVRHATPDLKQIQAQYKTLFERYGTSSETLKLQLSYADFLALHYKKKADAISFLKDALKAQLSKIDSGQLKLKLADILVTDQKFNLHSRDAATQCHEFRGDFRPWYPKGQLSMGMTCRHG